MYKQLTLNKREARGRNGVFDAELVEFSISWQEPEHTPSLVIEVWSRRRAEGQAPIRFTMSMSECLDFQMHVSDVCMDAMYEEQRFLGEDWQSPERPTE